jgi:hypothetical protein
MLPMHLIYEYGKKSCEFDIKHKKKINKKMYKILHKMDQNDYLVELDLHI